MWSLFLIEHLYVSGIGKVCSKEWTMKQLCAQNASTILSLTVRELGGSMWSFKEKEDFTLESTLLRPYSDSETWKSSWFAICYLDKRILNLIQRLKMQVPTIGQIPQCLWLKP